MKCLLGRVGWNKVPKEATALYSKRTCLNVNRMASCLRCSRTSIRSTIDCQVKKKEEENTTEVIRLTKYNVLLERRSRTEF